MLPGFKNKIRSNIRIIKTFYLTVLFILIACLPVIATVTVPHGNYLATSQLCLRCHRIHEAPTGRWQDVRKGTFLLRKQDEKEVCYTCHDGSGSSYNVVAEYGDTRDGSSTKTSFHPVPTGVIVCTDCHTPHKQIENFDSTHTADEVIRLLRGKFATFFGYLVDPLNTAWIDKGADPNFRFPAQQRLANRVDMCGSCHGSGTTLPGGDHTSYFKDTPHDTATPDPPAPTESKIKCLNCHVWHASDMKPLLETTIAGNPITGRNNSICFSCHILAAGAYSGQTLFSTVKHSTVTTSTTSSPIWPGSDYQPGYCLNCHNPHGTATTDYRRADKNNLCATCHEAGTLPANYSYRGIDNFNQTPHSNTTNTATKWPYANETGAAVGLGGSQPGECINCHNPHGKDNGSGGYFAKLTLRNEEDLCFAAGAGACHSSTSGSEKGINIQQRFTANSDPYTHHDVSDADQSATGAKVECINCHDPHINNRTYKNVNPDSRYTNLTTTVTDVTLYPQAVIQPGPTAGKDATILGFDPNTNYGTADVLWIGKVFGAPSRAVLQFDLSSIPNTATITSAKLSLPRTSGIGLTLTIDVYRNTQSWLEGTVTYNNAPNFDPTPVVSTSVNPVYAWFDWDITSLVQSWINGTYANYGVTMRAPTAETSGSDWYAEFPSSDKGNSDEGLNPDGTSKLAERPRLTIQYTTANPPQVIDRITFCGTCHDGSPPAGVVIPSGIRQIIPNYTNTGSTGDYHGGRVATNPNGYGELIGPYYFGIGALACTNCHDPHGSKNAYFIKETVNGQKNITVPLSPGPSNYTQIQKFCASCHTFTHVPSYNCFFCHFHGANADTNPSTFF